MLARSAGEAGQQSNCAWKWTQVAICVTGSNREADIVVATLEP